MPVIGWGWPGKCSKGRCGSRGRLVEQEGGLCPASRPRPRLRSTGAAEHSTARAHPLGGLLIPRAYATLQNGQQSAAEQGANAWRLQGGSAHCHRRTQAAASASSGQIQLDLVAALPLFHPLVRCQCCRRPLRCGALLEAGRREGGILRLGRRRLAKAATDPQGTNNREARISVSGTTATKARHSHTAAFTSAACALAGLLLPVVLRSCRSEEATAAWPHLNWQEKSS